MSHDTLDPLLTPGEVAEHLRIDRETVYLWMRKGIIRYVEIGVGEWRPRKRVRTSEVARQLREPQSQRSI
jgi:excisionase family DNA binding protein